jgi:hypothetical protein
MSDRIEEVMQNYRKGLEAIDKKYEVKEVKKAQLIDTKEIDEKIQYEKDFIQRLEFEGKETNKNMIENSKARLADAMKQKEEIEEKNKKAQERYEKAVLRADNKKASLEGEKNAIVYLKDGVEITAEERDAIEEERIKNNPASPSSIKEVKRKQKDEMDINDLKNETIKALTQESANISNEIQDKKIELDLKTAQRKAFRYEYKEGTLIPTEESYESMLQMDKELEDIKKELVDLNALQEKCNSYLEELNQPSKEVERINEILKEEYNTTQEKPDQEKPEQEKPEQEKPEQEKPEQEKPEQEKPEQEKPDQEKPDQEKPEQEKPEQEKPEQEKPEQEKPQQEKPEQEKPQQEKPEQEKPDQEKPEQEKPEQEEPDQEKPEQEKPEQEEPHYKISIGRTAKIVVGNHEYNLGSKTVKEAISSSNEELKKIVEECITQTDIYGLPMGARVQNLIMMKPEQKSHILYAVRNGAHYAEIYKMIAKANVEYLMEECNVDKTVVNLISRATGINKDTRNLMVRSYLEKCFEANEHFSHNENSIGIEYDAQSLSKVNIFKRLFKQEANNSEKCELLSRAMEQNQCGIADIKGKYKINWVEKMIGKLGGTTRLPEATDAQIEAAYAYNKIREKEGKEFRESIKTSKESLSKEGAKELNELRKSQDRQEIRESLKDPLFLGQEKQEKDQGDDELEI